MNGLETRSIGMSSLSYSPYWEQETAVLPTGICTSGTKEHHGGDGTPGTDRVMRMLLVGKSNIVVALLGVAKPPVLRESAIHPIHPAGTTFENMTVFDGAWGRHPAKAPVAVGNTAAWHPCCQNVTDGPEDGFMPDDIQVHPSARHERRVW
jgi:hypothetical protein